jgi:hypothetical protein
MDLNTHPVALLRAGREGQNDRPASERDYEFSSCNRGMQ